MEKKSKNEDGDGLKDGRFIIEASIMERRWGM